MFALNRLAVATGEPQWNDLAVQLAKAIHPHFMTKRGHHESMVWKVSIDMGHPLVNSKGNLDDVDGLVIYQLLQDTAESFNKQSTSNGSKQSPTLDAEIEHYRRIMTSHPKSLSGDPLDLGMSLWICHFDREAEWSRELAKKGLTIARDRFLPAAQSPITASRRGYRLAFREFGACLGIKCYVNDPSQSLRDDTNRVLEAWEGKLLSAADEDLRPINLTMYAAALIPGGEL
ncbi:hypothetical protein F5Y04DRAFT_264992 [Hypomontagnella monticulosa]|nr:hypothetical protein F5Y04DRAFT_264992 [Hypomontagnella monticulosa]